MDGRTDTDRERDRERERERGRKGLVSITRPVKYFTDSFLLILTKEVNYISVEDLKSIMKIRISMFRGLDHLGAPAKIIFFSLAYQNVSTSYFTPYFNVRRLCI